MTLIPSIAGILALLLFIALGAIIRFSIVSSWRTRNSSSRLEQPDALAVERICGFSPPADLIHLYRDGSIARLSEFSLVDTTKQPPAKWVFGRIYPLTGLDASEQRRVHGLETGIPIGDDLDKGVYFVTADGKVMFRPAGRDVGSVEVAPSASALARFKIVDDDA